MKIKKLNRDKTIIQQVNAIRAKYSSWKITFDTFQLKAVGIIQPTPRSEKYTVEIKFYLFNPIQVRILKPILILNETENKIPHMYSQETLCLYMPKYAEFTRKNYISATIIPWTYLWLYYYELWHTTGEWKGGGIHIE